MFNSDKFVDRWVRHIGAFLILSISLFLAATTFLLNPSSNPNEKLTTFHRLLAPLVSLEDWFYDVRTARFYEHERKSPNLVILELADSTLQRIGRWPWTRTVHAKLLDALQAYGARVVLFDVLFPEPESPKADQALFDAIQRFTKDPHNAVVLGYGITTDSSSALTPRPDALLTSALTGIPGNSASADLWFVDKNNFAAPKLAESNAVFGFLTAKSDDDGVFRRSLIVNELEKGLYPSLGLAAYVAFFAADEEHKVFVDQHPGTHNYELKFKSPQAERVVELNQLGELKIRFFGGAKNFIRVPAEEVFFDKKPETNEKMKALFAGKTVLFGSSALGAHDLRNTPADRQMPGMYMHANLFHALDQTYLYRDDSESFLLSLLLIVLGTGAILLLSRLKDPIRQGFGAAIVMGGLYSADYYYFAPQGYFIRLFSALLSTGGLYGWFTVLDVIREAKEKRKIRSTFTRYVSPKIVKDMLANPEKLKVGGERKDITMMFSDVRDFTSISERLSPQDLSTLLNLYMGKMTKILFDTDGTLDKYIGDALVGFWGAPWDVAEHAYRGTMGAKLMLETLPLVNKEFAERKLPKISIGIGVNSGEVSVGNMGSDMIFQYTALGDHMNLASRLESLTKHYGVGLIISEFTREKMGERQKEFRLRPIDLVQVKGKSQAVKIFEVIPDWSPWAKEGALLDLFRETYQEYYLKGRFAEAKERFGRVLESIPGDKATMHLVSAAEGFLKAPPPEGWDGVTIFTTK